jgi:hypothetical protein
MLTLAVSAALTGFANSIGDDEEKKKQLLAALAAERKRAKHIEALRQGREKPAGEFFLIIPARAQ